MEKELRRGEHGHVGPPHRVFEAVVRGQPRRHERHVGLDGRLVHRPAEGPRQEGREEPAGVVERGRRLYRLERPLLLGLREVLVGRRNPMDHLTKLE